MIPNRRVYELKLYTQGDVPEKRCVKDFFWIKKLQYTGVHCDMLESKCIFFAEKLFSQA